MELQALELIDFVDHSLLSYALPWVVRKRREKRDENCFGHEGSTEHPDHGLHSRVWGFAAIVHEFLTVTQPDHPIHA